MLNSNIISFFWKKSIKSGFYVDFIAKQLLHGFLTNIVIFGALFFGEKVILEYLTRTVNTSYSLNKIGNQSSHNLLSFIAYTLTLGLAVLYCVM